MQRKIMIFTFLFCLFALTVSAGTVYLAWDPCTDNPDGIRIYANKSPNVEAIPANLIAEVTPGTETTAHVQSLLGRYYFVATAFKIDPVEGVLESAKSNEVTTVVKPNSIINLHFAQ